MDRLWRFSGSFGWRPSRISQDKLVSTAARAAVTLAILWLDLVSAATATVILRAKAPCSIISFWLSRTWRDRLLGAGTGATLTLVTLWLILVSGAAAAVILRT